MKRTIKRTEITIESLEITTIRRASSGGASPEDAGTTLAEVDRPENRLAPRMERVKQILRRKKR